MFNPILSELVGREQHNERLRLAQQRQLVEAGIRRQRARFDLRTRFDNLREGVERGRSAMLRLAAWYSNPR